MNRRKATVAAGAAVLLLAGAAGVVRAALKCTPGVDDLWCVRPAACRSPGGHEPHR